MKKLSLFVTIIFAWTLTSCPTNTPLCGKWDVVAFADSYNGTDEVYTLQFHDDGHFSFTTDCNTVSGDFQISGKQLRFLNLAATEIACDNEVVEQQVKSLLPIIESYDLTNDSILSLLGKHGDVLITLHASAPETSSGYSAR